MQVVSIAKKVPVEEKEEPEVFKFPEFDEVEYVKKELKETKGALTVVLIGVIFAIFSFVFTAFQQPGIGFLLGLVGMASIKYILNAVKVDTSAYKLKNWLGHIGSYFFIWLAIWILLMNAPFSDFAKPTIKDVKVYANVGGNSTLCELKFYSEGAKAVVKNSSAVESIMISANITDNGGLGNVRLVDKEGKEVCGYKRDGVEYIWEIKKRFSAGEETLKLRITATDNAGNYNIFAIELDFQ